MPAKPLSCVVSVSGIRGVLGSTLGPDQLLALAAAFGTAVAGGRVVAIGRDSRPTGSLVVQAVSAGLRGVGCTVVDLGLVPTPTVPFAVARGGGRFGGGIQVSASHNPIEWNALKFYGPDGRNVDQKQLDAILAAYQAEPAWKRWDGVGGHREDQQILDHHLEAVLASVDTALIRRAAIPVLLDSVNGAGAVLAPRLLSALGCALTAVHVRPELPFPRDPEPTAEKVVATGALVRACGAAIGFVQDPDADRLALIDGDGTYIGEEYTLALCAAARLAAAEAEGRAGQVIATNLSTSRMVEDIAARHRGRVVRTPVGEAHVLDAMQAEGALLGGEGNGGVIDPRVVWCRDSQVGIALVLEYLARTGKTLKEVVAALPRYAMVKRKIAVDRATVTAAIPRIRAADLAQAATIDARDGLKLSWPDRWVHVRASGTEPASRIIAEAPDQAGADALVAAVGRLLG